MFNAVRMDIYRLIHTKSAYVILVIAMALAIAMSGMTALVRSCLLYTSPSPRD